MALITRGSRPVALLMLVLLAITACSSSGSAGGSGSRGAAAAPSVASSSGSSAASSPAGSSSASSSAADPTLSAVLLKRSDFSPGWAAKASPPDPNAAAGQKALVACVGGRDTSAQKTGTSDAMDYESGPATISSNASRFNTQAAVDADVQILRSPKINLCYAKLARTQIGRTLPAGTTVRSVTVKVVPGASGGPSNVAATGAGKIELVLKGQVVPVYVAIAFITGRQLEAEVVCTYVGQPVAPAVCGKAAETVAARAAAYR